MMTRSNSEFIGVTWETDQEFPQKVKSQQTLDKWNI